MKDSNIAWTHHTFNPWWGCVPVSPGCAHCYAEQFALRTGHKVWGKQAPRRFFGDKHWNEPLKWNRDAEKAGFRHRVFCASMADWLEDREELNEPLERLMNLIRHTWHLDWLLLTKRPELWEKRASIVDKLWLEGYEPPNVWVGTTVEDQTRAEERIPALLRIPAKVHFLSCEPMLGPMDFQVNCWNEFFGSDTSKRWVICGGESGNKRRSFEPAWAESLASQCLASEIPFFMKQDGNLFPGQQGRLSDSLWSLKDFPTPEKRGLVARVAAALSKNQGATVLVLTEQFWREDNPGSIFREPPSMAYEAVETAFREVMLQSTRPKLTTDGGQSTELLLFAQHSSE